jgi:hypothetical protein
MQQEFVTPKETSAEEAREKELVLQALRRALPAKDRQAWLHAPNLDLDSRTPVEAIAEGDYGPVIEALWLRDPSVGPVS